MVSPVFASTPVNPLPHEIAVVRETAIKRKLSADLVRIRELFRPDMRDGVSQLIEQWHTNFTRGLRERSGVENAGESEEERFNRILNRHLQQMRNLLRDPITNTPLDREAVLGNDGETYGFKSLCLALHLLAPQHAHSSPLHPNLAVPFTQRPHLLARHMVGFLAEWNALDSSAALDAEFEACFHGVAPVIPETPVANAAPAPVPRPAPRRRYMTLADLGARGAAEPPVNPAPQGRRPRIVTLADLRPQEAPARAQGRSRIVTLADLRAEEEEPPPQVGFSEADLANLLGVIDAQAEREAEAEQQQAGANAAFAENLQGMVGDVLEGIEEEFEPVGARRMEFAAIFRHRIDVARAANAENRAQDQQEIDALRQEIADVSADIEELPTHIHTLDHEILEAKRENLELELSMKELDVAIDEKKDSSLGALGDLLTTGLCVAFTAIGCYAAAYWKLNAAFAAMPMHKGALIQGTFFL